MPANPRPAAGGPEAVPAEAGGPAVVPAAGGGPAEVPGAGGGPAEVPGAGGGGPGPLRGRRILVLRPQDQAEELAAALRAAGAEPVAVPAIRILPASDWAPVEAALGRPHGWTVFTSVNGVRAVAGRLGGALLAQAAAGRLAAVGPATAAALREHGLEVAFVPARYTTVALGEELPGPPGPVCLVRAGAAGADLETILSRRGFTVERVDAYRTEPAGTAAITAALAEGVDAVALTSASIATAFAAAHRAAGATGASGPGAGRRRGALVSIGPATTAACRAEGLPVAAEASPHTIPGLVAALVTLLGGPATPPATMGL
jgi:uroporphyrinogen-III synthase